MDKELLKIIRSNEIIYSYLREDSSEYKYLLSDSNYINTIYKKAKIKYNLTLESKINKLVKKLELINEIIDILN